MLETNELTRNLRTLLHPRAALIVYTEENCNHDVYDNCYFIEVRDIDGSGTMGEGRPVTVEFMNDWYGDIPKGTVPRHMEGYRPICYGATRARAARDTSGTILPGNG